MPDEYVGEDERVRLMMVKDEVTCVEQGHAEGEFICVRCGIPLVVTGETYADRMLRREKRWRDHVRDGGD